MNPSVVFLTETLVKADEVVVLVLALALALVVGDGSTKALVVVIDKNVATPKYVTDCIKRKIIQLLLLVQNDFNLFVIVALCSVNMIY
mmetsp:Transcript_42089/g.46887  ORF Transcript_42089/g.46887 Transcript_42089/m.46887 type:complete len:88 (-) Transcript_42089:49-312(-)